MRLFREKNKINKPSNVQIEYFENKVLFKGPKEGISRLAEEIRSLSKLKHGQTCKIDKLTLKISDFITSDREKKYWVELPDHGWNIMASKFQDVVEQFDQNPFEFNQCGYTLSNPYDIGILITDLPNTKDEK